MKLRGTLTFRVVLVLAVAAVIPTLALGALAIYNTRQVLEGEVVRGNLALIRVYGSSLDTTLQDARRTLKLAAGWWADSRTAESSGDSGDSGDSAGGERDGETERLLKSLREQVSLFSALAIVDVEGRPRYGDIDIPDLGVGVGTFGSYIGDVVFEDARPSVWMVAQARNRTGELVGAFVARLDLHFMAEALADARLAPGARLLVVDGDGIPVARSEGPIEAELPSLRGTDPAVDAALSSATEGSLERDGAIAVYRNLSSYQSVRGVRWAILMQQPEREAYALARITRDNTVLVGLVVLALSLLGGVLLAARLTRPLRLLAARADAIAEHQDLGDSDAPPPIVAPGEIGHLAQRIEEMARRIGEREKLQSALARGDRLAAVGTMAASVAHEVNNPLTTVLGYAKLLLEDKPEQHADRPGLELIAEEAERMKGIIGTLLDYSRSERAPRPEGRTDVNESLRHTAALMVPQLRRMRVELELELGEDLPPAAAGSHALQQVFVNLVQNAAQSMLPAGGPVRVSSALGPGKVALVVQVSDEGPGVPEAERKRIFEPFVTTKVSGTGLGLAVCKHLVVSFGGSIEVSDNASGRGATFRVVIPIEEGVR
ncbi:sensor histidine kinase [Haliangium ochraceum]|uniref:histidine kinase n=1 Tax=Haliangium ochraceum (strain DSM 14365 / JCM 11303 / SMP-2) TaxID=502025 RepID=D0LIH2_HALO1|nr:ATP-binding protein [Haliangium ochraceum]ACY18328.1 integral membrane sensor signal transduction histidine kinase [Haliangium ochraceum DSM 14365]